MNYTWSLDILYTGFDDSNFKKDLQLLDTVIDDLQTCVLHLDHHQDANSLCTYLKAMEVYVLLVSKLASFAQLRQSVDTMDKEAAMYINQIGQKTSDFARYEAIANRFISDIRDLDYLLDEQEELQNYAYLLKKIQENQRFALSETQEEIFTKMNLSGGNAWQDLWQYLTSVTPIEMDDEKFTLSQIRNMAYSLESSKRKKAYEAELAGYANIKDAISFSLNSIKAQVNTESELRGFEDPLHMTLHKSHMRPETLTALWNTIGKYLPKFHEYFKRKASLLGYENGLPFYELFAPIGESHTHYEIEDAKNYLVKHFRIFADDLAEMVETAFNDRWIDFLPRKGKVGGAFCANLSFVKQSRILTNYDYGIGDIVTLAHELGHAYHGMMIQDHLPLNTSYSMPVAETASTFNENLIMNAAIDEAIGEEKIALIENQLQDLAQIICDIYSRFLFEDKVFKTRKDHFLFADELEQIMIDAQKEAYGDGLDSNYLHPYMWICKPHYYSPSTSYYNFPYAFGGLFARGLIVKYQEDKEKFVPKYRNFLKATTIADVELAAHMLGADLTQEDFWIASLETCVTRIDEFLELTKKEA